MLKRDGERIAALTDAYAVMAGLDGIAFPADGVVGVARAIGRPFHQEHACCSIKLGAAPAAAFVAGAPRAALSLDAENSFSSLRG